VGCWGNNRIGSGREGRLHRIADHFEERAVVRLGGRPQQGQMACDSGYHRHLVPLPQRATALDVGEEEGDGAGGEIGHEPFPNVRHGEISTDCRMAKGQTALEWLTISSSASRPYTEHLGHDPVVLRFTADDAARQAA
jgi:hypothetical protein